MEGMATRGYALGAGAAASPASPSPSPASTPAPSASAAATSSSSSGLASRLGTLSAATTTLRTLAGGGGAGGSVTGKGGDPVYDRNLASTKSSEVSLAAMAYLLSSMIQYTQNRVDGIAELERKLNTFGYRVGQRLLELLNIRDPHPTVMTPAKAPKREIKVLGLLYFVHTQVWKACFGKVADALEKSTEHDDEYMISDNDPPLTRFISIPKEMSTLNCSAFAAGIVEAILDGSQFPARVTAHSTPSDGHPKRSTLLLKFDAAVIQRDRGA